MLRSMLRKLVKVGRLSVIIPGQEVMHFGELGASQTTRHVVIRLKDRWTAIKIAVYSDLYLGQCYMDGDLVMEQGSMWDLLDLCGRNLSLQGPPKDTGLIATIQKGLARFHQLNARRASRRNVSHHYDLSSRLYRLFLDEDLQYSCAYFPTPDATLDQAQFAKKRHIAAKLALRPGLRVLDIGCGWGGLALFLAKTYDVDVLGITLSQEQLSVARERAKKLGLQDRVQFELIDYRDVQGQFDRIVSVGMFEHVGTPNYDTYFSALSRLLTPSGVALIHSIGRAHGPSYTSAWIRKYIFPGGYLPAISEVMPSVEKSGLWTTDLEILRLHYAETLRCWRERFLKRRELLMDLYDDRFFRMWEFYLGASEMSFRHAGIMVFQIQLAKTVDALPVTRDYMVEAERHADVVQRVPVIA